MPNPAKKSICWACPGQAEAAQSLRNRQGHALQSAVDLGVSDPWVSDPRVGIVWESPNGHLEAAS